MSLSKRKITYTDIPKSSFGEAITVQPTPTIQFDVPYGTINTQVGETSTNGANSAVTAADGLVSIYCDGTVNSFAELKSRAGLIYKPGQGMSCKFTALFETANATANFFQIAGAGNPEDGFFVGVNQTNGFGILHRRGGRREVQVLNIDTAANAAANVTLTLDDIEYTVALTDASNANSFTAYEIQDGNAYGNKWIPQQVGDNIIFLSTTASAVTGNFSANWTTSGANGTWSQAKAGNAPTNSWTYQSSFNVDPLDGTGRSKMTLDPTKLNVFEIQYGWLGSSNIDFYIQNPVNGDMVLFHQISYTNQNTVPSLQNPQLEMFYRTSGAEQTIKMASFCSSVLGMVDGDDIQYATAGSKSSITTETVILTLKNPEMYNSLSNHSLIKMNSISLASSGGNAPVTFYVRKNASLGAGTTADYTNYGYIDPTESPTLIDTTADTFSGGKFVFAYQLGATDSIIHELSNIYLSLRPGETLSVSAATTNATTAGCALNWGEDQ